MNQGNVRKSELGTSAQEFDPRTFVNQILATIAQARSDLSAQQNVLFESATDLTGGQEGESILNCFLRLMGFPATRSESEFANQNPTPQALSQNNTLNYFSEGELGDDIAQEIFNREQALNKKQEIKDAFNMICNPLPINASIEPSTARPFRPALFPLVVSADVPVFPVRKRTAPIFNKGDFIQSRTRLTRPFIEHIIYMRTQVLSGRSDSPLKQQLEDNIRATFEVFENSDLESAAESTQFRDELLSENSDYNLLELKILDKFIKALRKSVENYSLTLKKIETLKAKVNYFPAPKKTPNEKAGEQSLSLEEKKQLLIDVCGFNEQDAENAVRGSLDVEIERYQFQLAQLNDFLRVMPIETVKASDEIRRIGGEIQVSNIINDVFVSEFTYLLTFERDEIERNLAAAKDKRARAIRELEIARQEISYFTGEFTGLSIFDIICVLSALFTVEERHVVALLNSGAQANLITNNLIYSKNSTSDNLIKPTTIDDVASNTSTTSVSKALQAIETATTNFFNLALAFQKEFEKAGENKTPKKGG